MNRKIAVIIDFDEARGEELMPGAAPGDYIEREFGWLKQSGIFLDKWLILDDDDVSDWARYINYLIQLAFDNSYSENCENISLLSFKEWKNKHYMYICEDDKVV